MHAEFHCPKFGCDICLREEFQHMTRGQLEHHIKHDCPDVPVMCQVCNREYIRSEFHNHQCIKDFYIEKLKQNEEDVLDALAEALLLHRRQQKKRGTCMKQECQAKARAN